MATIKNFGIVGIGQSVQYGKGGGKVVYDTGNSLFKVTTDGTTLSNLDVADPTGDTHAASKGYVDSVAQGLDVKDSVRAASTADVNTSSAPSSIDGVSLANGDRILLKDQATPSQNGIYVFSSAGAALTRAVDMDAEGEFVGAFFFVEEGTANSDQGFVCTTDGPVNVGSTNITFSQFTGTGQISPGAGLSKSANTINVNVDNTFIEIDGNDALTIKGTATTGEVLQSDGSGGVTYGTVNLASTNAVSGILPLANGGLGTEASTTSGKTTARTNLGLGTIATQNANNVNITGGTIDISGGTLTLADNQINGDKVSGGTIDSANLLGGAGNTISGYDITVGSGKTLDVDGVLDVDGAAGSAIDNVVIGGTTSAAGTFSNLTSGNVDINGGAIDGTTIGANASAAGTFTTVTTTGLKADTVEATTGGGDITFNSPINAAAGINVAGVTSPNMNADTINEDTVGAGVTVDGVLLKDGNVTANVGTFTSTVVTSADIDGGTIDGTVIGGTTAAAGTFTDLASNNVTLTGGSISGTNVDMTGQTLTLDDDSISGDKVHGGVISNFASTGIDDNATSTMLTLSPANATPVAASHTGTIASPSTAGGADGTFTATVNNTETADLTGFLDNTVVGHDFAGDGSHVYMLSRQPAGQTHPDTIRIFQFPLTGSAFDLSNVDTANGTDVLISGLPTWVDGFRLSSDGTKLYLAMGTTVNQYTLGTARNITSVVQTPAKTFTKAGNRSPGVAFNATGTKVYFVERNAEEIHQYDLGTAWDISTAVASGTFDLTNGGSVGTGVFIGGDIHPDGNAFYVVDSTDGIMQIALGTADDINSASYSTAPAVARASASFGGIFSAGFTIKQTPTVDRFFMGEASTGTPAPGGVVAYDFTQTITAGGATTESILVNGQAVDFSGELADIIQDINSYNISGVTASDDGGFLKIEDADSDLVLAENGGTALVDVLGMTAGTYNYTASSAATASFSDDVSIAGNLTVSGTLTSIQTTNTTITDNTITLNDGETGAGVTAGSAGIEIDRGTLDNATLLWNETTDVFELKVGSTLADLKVSNLAMTGISADQIGSLSGNGISITDDISGLDATFSGTLAVDTINEVSTATGVTVDGVLLKDGVVTGGLTAEAGDTVDVSLGTLTLANDQISGDSINGGTIDSITIDSLTSGSVNIDGGNIDGTTIGSAVSAAGTFSSLTSDSVDLNGGAIDGTDIGVNASGIGTFTTMNTSNADINGGNGDNFIIGAAVSAAGTFTTMTSDTVDINGGTIDGVSLTTSTVDINGGAIDGTIIGANTSAAGTFSVLTTGDAQITGGNVTGVTNGSFTNLTSGNVNITGGTITGIDIDTSGSAITFDDDAISGDKVHGGTISHSSLVGTTGSTISGYDITVGTGKTLDVSAGTLTLANDQISGDKVHGGTISNFASTGIDDNATSTKVTLTDTTATFGVAGDFGANTLAAGATTLASLNVTGDAVVSGNLTVSGAVTTTLSETVEIEDNLILLNSNHTGAATQDAGIEVNRGTEVGGNAKWYWDETADEWSSNGANINVGSISSSSFQLSGTIATTDGGTGTDTSSFADDSLMIMSGTGTTVSELAKGANSTVLKVNASGALGYAQVALTTDVSGTLPIANGGTGLSTNGSDRQLLVVDATGALGYEYVGTLRNSTGLATINTSNMASGTGEYLEVTNGTGRVTVTAKNAANSGIVDLYLQGQDGGDVFLVGDSGEALLQGEDDTDLTVAGGDSSAGDAGDLVLKGGNGSGSFISGSVIIKGGLGGATNGNVEILGPNDTAIAVFTETSSTAADNFEFKNGTGGLELAAVGSSTDVNLTLAPKGAGIILAPAGYDMSSAAGEALATKDYVDSQINANGDNFIRQSFAANGSSSFTVGTLKNISGQTYYVSRITVKITTAFVGADELVISDGTNTLVGALDTDISETGFFIIDQGYENTSAGGATITATIGNGGASASPTVGNVIVGVEYKAL